HVLGSVEDSFRILENNREFAVFVPIGSNNVRVKLLKNYRERGYQTPSFIHRNTIIDKSVKLGDAVYILPGVIIMPLTTIKDYTMISVGVNISHHTNIEEGCFFSHGSNIGASINIASEAYIGI